MTDDHHRAGAAGLRGAGLDPRFRGAGLDPRFRGAGLDPRSRGAGLAAVVLATTAFSWGFVIVKVLPLPGPTIAAWRLAIGAGVLAVAALVLRAPWPRRWGIIAIAGAAFGVHQLLFIAATKATSIAVVTLVGALQPLLVALVSRRLLREPVPRALAGWAVLAVAGVALVVQATAGHGSRSLAGDVLALVNLLVFTAFFLATKRARDAGTPTLTFTAGFLAVALVVVAPALAFTGGPVHPGGAGALGLLALLALVPGNGHLLVTWAHTRVTAALSSLVLAAVPLLASTWAWLLLDEPLTWRHGVGGLMVAAAIEGGRRADAAARRAREARSEHADGVLVDARP